MVSALGLCGRGVTSVWVNSSDLTCRIPTNYTRQEQDCTVAFKCASAPTWQPKSSNWTAIQASIVSTFVSAAVSIWRPSALTGMATAVQDTTLLISCSNVTRTIENLWSRCHDKSRVNKWIILHKGTHCLTGLADRKPPLDHLTHSFHLNSCTSIFFVIIHPLSLSISIIFFSFESEICHSRSSAVLTWWNQFIHRWSHFSCGTKLCSEY